MIQHDGRCCRSATVNRPPSRPGRSLQTLGRSDSVAVACSFNNAAPLACSVGARRPQLLPLVLRRVPPLGEEDLERVVRQISSPCCTWFTCVKLVKPRTLAGLRRRSRACRSDFGDGDLSCGAAEAYVPAGSSWTEPAARARILEAKTAPGVLCSEECRIKVLND